MHIIWGGCGSGDRAGHLQIKRLGVWCLDVPFCIPKYIWARYCTLSCSQCFYWSVNVRYKALSVNGSYCVKLFKCSSGVEKCNLRISPFKTANSNAPQFAYTDSQHTFLNCHLLTQKKFPQHAHRSLHCPAKCHKVTHRDPPGTHMALLVTVPLSGNSGFTAFLKGSLTVSAMAESNVFDSILPPLACHGH